MFIMHISALLAYSVLLGSTVLIIWSIRNKGKGRILANTIGALVLILSLFSMICIGYYGIKYWAHGNFDTSSDMSMKMQNGMKEKMMPMMMEKMTDQMGQMQNMDQMENMGMQKDKDH